MNLGLFRRRRRDDSLALVLQLAAADAENARLRKALSDESFIAAHLRSSANAREVKLTALQAEIAHLNAELADAVAPVTAPPANTECVCGGDAELYWRRRAVDAERQVARHQANALVLTDQLAAAEGREVSAGDVQ